MTGPSGKATLEDLLESSNHLRNAILKITKQIRVLSKTDRYKLQQELLRSILSKAIGTQVFWDLPELETFLILFYEKYNKHRIHDSIANLLPRLFWNLWEEGKISRTVLKKQ